MKNREARAPRRRREFDWIDWLRGLEDGSSPRSLVLGIGDDAAVWLPPRGAGVVLSTDAQVEGVHFRRTHLSYREIGRRAVTAGVSDLAAMAARPACVLVAVLVEESLPSADFRKLYRGMRDAASGYGAPIVGGNLGVGPLSLTVTAVGHREPERLARRSRARAGDEIWVSGTPGLSRLGLQCLERHLTGTRAVRAAIRAYTQPRARVEEALHLEKTWPLHAMIDLSDGLPADVAHILEESSRATGTKLGAEIDEATLDFAGLTALAGQLGESAVAAALGASDDYELCFTVAASRSTSRRVASFRRKFGVALTRIGHVVDSPGLRLRGRNGTTKAIEATGWAHL